METRRVLNVTEQLTYWSEPHPDWKPNPDWPEDVGCVLYDGPGDVVLIDPLIRDDLNADSWAWLDDAVARADKPVVVLLTAPWHERSVRDVVPRYDAQVWTAPEARRRVEGLPLRDVVPDGVTVFAPRGVHQGQVAFWIASEAALVVAEFFLSTPEGVSVAPAPGTPDLEEFIRSLHELRELPVERLLVGHGPPILEGGSHAIADALRRFVA